MISQKRYVDITSGVGGGAGVRTRQLILRIITTNTLLAPGQIKEFETADDVLTFFGDSSEEYKRAVRYFGFISKSVTAPQLISFSRWVDVAVPPQVRATTAPATLAALKAISAGSMQFDIDGVTTDVTAIDLSAATDLTNVATLLTAKVATIVNNPVLSNSTFQYDTGSQRYSWTGGQSTVTVKFNNGGSNDVAAMIGLASTDAIVTAGQAAESPVDAISKSAGQNNNFGSFLFTYGSGISADPDATTEIGQWNKAQNNMYMFLVGIEQKWLTETEVEDPSSRVSQYKGLSGLAVTALVNGIANQANPTFDEQIPGEILAATDYTSQNATQNYMYYQFSDRVATVTDDEMADWYDKNRFNYIGRTQTAGQLLEFYQRGTLGGGATDAVDMNVYANEMWLKDYLSAQYLSTFLSLPTVPANDIGEAMLIAVMQGGVDQAKFNGVISAGKDLNVQQQLYISQITGDKTAWHQVQTLGYWFNIRFLSRVTTDGRTEYYAKYILVYSKDDAVRAVEGQDVLI